MTIEPNAVQPPKKHNVAKEVLVLLQKSLLETQLEYCMTISIVLKEN